MINQRGEIITIAIVVTFLVLSVATIAASVMTQNRDTAQVTSSRAADACQVGKPKGHYCEYKSNNFGAPPYCVRVDWGSSCEDKYVRDDSISGCCSAPVTAQVDTSGSCSIGKACAVDACNDTKGGSSAKCPICNGGWCAAGKCATCGKQTATSAQQQQQAAQPGATQSTGSTTTQASGNAACPKSAIPSCGSGNANNGEKCSCKAQDGSFTGEQECLSTGWDVCRGGGTAPAATTAPATSSGSGTSGGGTSTGSSGSTGSTGSTVSAGGSSDTTTTTTKNSCTIRAYFQDSGTNANIKDVTVSFTPEHGGGGTPNTGSLTDYYSNGVDYNADSGKITIKASADGYTPITQVSTLNPTGVKTTCDITIKMSKKYVQASFKCPDGESMDSTCGGSSSCNASTKTCEVSTEEGSNICYKCIAKPATQSNCPAPAMADSNCNGSCPGLCHAVGSCFTCGSAAAAGVKNCTQLKTAVFSNENGTIATLNITNPVSIATYVNGTLQKAVVHTSDSTPIGGSTNITDDAFKALTFNLDVLSSGYEYVSGPVKSNDGNGTCSALFYIHKKSTAAGAAPAASSGTCTTENCPFDKGVTLAKTCKENSCTYSTVCGGGTDLTGNNRGTDPTETYCHETNRPITLTANLSLNRIHIDEAYQATHPIRVVFNYTCLVFCSNTYIGEKDISLAEFKSKMNVTANYGLGFGFAGSAQAYITVPINHKDNDKSVTAFFIYREPGQTKDSTLSGSSTSIDWTKASSEMTIQLENSK